MAVHDPDGPVAPRDLRVSQAERDHISALLNRHHVEGRLDGLELAERLATASAAVVRADLNRTVADLPGALDTTPARDVLELTNTAGDLSRRGEWLVPPRVVVRSRFGNAHLDMRRARFVTGTVAVDVDLGVGNLVVRLPEGATVDVSDVRTTVGMIRDRRGASAVPGARHVVLRGRVAVGNISVR